MRYFRTRFLEIACQATPSGAIMPPNVLSRAATKQRTCALSDTLSARVLLGEHETNGMAFRLPINNGCCPDMSDIAGVAISVDAKGCLR